MSDDPATPLPPVLVILDQEEVVNNVTPSVDCSLPTPLRPSTSPTSSTPSSSPDDRKLKESELLNGEESLVNSHFAIEDDGTSELTAQVGRVALSEPINEVVNLVLGNDTPIIQVDNKGSDSSIVNDSDCDSVRLKASPVQVDSGRNGVNPPTNQVVSGQGKQVVIPVIDLEADRIVDYVMKESSD